MNLFLDTSNNNFCFYVFDQNQKLLFEKNVNGVRRHSELLPLTHYEFLQATNVTVDDLLNIYLTIGPGSYTGMRLGLTFIKTLKLVNPNIKVYFIQSPQIYVDANYSGVHEIDARGGFYYVSQLTNGILDNIKVSSKQENADTNLKINFLNVIKHINANHFKIQTNLFEFKLNYYKTLNLRKLR